MNQRVRRLELPVGLRLIPHTVEPDATDRPVVGEQLGELRIHVGDVAREAACIRPIGCSPSLTARKIIRMMPVELRIVKKQLQPFFRAGIRQLAHHIARERRTFHDVVVGDFRVPERYPIMMARDECDVLHSGRFCRSRPRRRIELRGIETRHQTFVVGGTDATIVHHPFAVLQNRRWPPVNEQAELRVLVPAACGQILGRGLIRDSGLRLHHHRGAQRRSHTRNESLNHAHWKTCAGGFDGLAGTRI